MPSLHNQLKKLDSLRAKVSNTEVVLAVPVGEALRRLRKAHKVPLRLVAEAAGLTVTTLWEVEHGVSKTSMTAKTYDKIVQAVAAAKKLRPLP